MKAVVQRVSRAQVVVNNQTAGKIDAGLLVFLGVTHDDDESKAKWLAKKIAHLRIFKDSEGLMNRSVLDTGGGVLVVSQFTLHGDARKGRRPSFVKAAGPDIAEPLYLSFVKYLQDSGLTKVETGSFGADMDVRLVNAGPVTLILDTEETSGA